MHDVVIVGGGPAGSTSAILLARQGLDVLVLDRARFPRDKPCGEFLTPGAVQILIDIGCWESIVSRATPVPSITITAPNGLQSVFPHPLTLSPHHPITASGWSIRRTELDETLLQLARHAGASVEEGQAVRALIRNADGSVAGVRTDAETISARLVIGADGAHSIVARELGLVHPIRRLQRIAIVSHWQGIRAQGLEMQSRSGIVCGFSPVGPDESNVTLVAPQSEASRIAGRHEAYLSEVLQTHFPDVASRLPKAASEIRLTGCFGHTASRVSAAGAMLVGDAAAFIDPFTGEGIYFAIHGAHLAARTAVRALKANDCSARRLSEYDLARTQLSARYRLCDIVQAVVRKPWLINRAVEALRSSPSLTESLMGVLGDERSPDEALNPGFAFRLLVSHA